METNGIDLWIEIDEKSKTIAILDKFEGFDENQEAYERLIFSNTFHIVTSKYSIDFHPIMVRWREKMPTIGDVTLSNLKKEKWEPLYDFVKDQIEELLKGNKGINFYQKEFIFSKYLYVRAQYSGNRMGYGWEWSGDMCVWEGTEYGETQDYCIIGIVVESYTEYKQKQQHADYIPESHVELFKGKKYYKFYKNEEESYLIPYDEVKTQKEAEKIFRDFVYK